VFNLTFLNALFLAGTAAGLVPIVIHLLNRRKLKRIEFSDLRFLAPLNQQRMRSLNLRRLWLLVLRVAIIVLTAIAMARPSVRGSLSRLFPAQARSSALFLIDTSYSMRAEGEHGTAMEGAKAMAQRLVDALERGDQANVMTFDDATHAEFEKAVHDLGPVRERISTLEAGHGGTNWSAALQAALADLRTATEPNRELYVLSDFAGTVSDSVKADLHADQGDVRVQFVPITIEPFINVSVEDVHVPPGAVLVGEPVRIGVTVRNHAPDVPADCDLQVELAGDPKGEANLRLGGGAIETHEFTLVATSPEASMGIVRKRIDRLPEDDARCFVLPLLAQLHVLFVKGSGDAGGAFFVSRALAPAHAGRAPLAVTEVDATRLSSRDLEGVQVVVVSSDAALAASQTQILADFVADGGGVFVMSGQRATAEITNQLLLDKLGGARIRGVVQQAQSFVNLDELRASGILAGFKDVELRTLEAVKFTRYAELTASGDARPVLKFSGGAPAVVEGVHGEGKYMLAAFDAGLDGSDLAVSSMFLPLLHRAVVYLAGETGRQRQNYTVGERIEVQVPLAPAERRADAGALDERLAQAGVSDATAPKGSAAGAAAAESNRNFTVTTPSGQKDAAVARFVGKMAIVSYDNTREPGHYIFEGAGRRIARAVNVNTRESDLRRADLKEFAKRLGIELAGTIDSPDAVSHAVREARHGKELYKLVVGLVLVLLTIELVLSRTAQQTPVE
jgi:hypothetical protein